MSTYSTAYDGFPTVYKQYTDTIGVDNSNSNTYLTVHSSEGAMTKRHSGGFGSESMLISSDLADYIPYKAGGRYNISNPLVSELGMIGVGTESSTGRALAIKVAPYGSGAWSSGGNVYYVNISLLMGNTVNNTTTTVCEFANDGSNTHRAVLWNQTVKKYLFSGKIDRTYFGYQNNGGPAISSICGFTFESYNKDGSLSVARNKDIPSGSGFHNDDNNNNTISLAIARMVPSDKTNANVIKDKEWSDSGLIIFSTLTNRVHGNLTDGSSTLPAIRLTQAISQNAMASNVGMTAVAVMATASGATYHLGCKNGIYKIYNGPEPYVTPSGTRVAIGKKEFISISYGSYYARMK